MVGAEALKSWQPFGERLEGGGGRWAGALRLHSETGPREVRQGAQCHTVGTTSRAPSLRVEPQHTRQGTRQPRWDTDPSTQSCGTPTDVPTAQGETPHDTLRALPSAS